MAGSCGGAGGRRAGDRGGGAPRPIEASFVERGAARRCLPLPAPPAVLLLAWRSLRSRLLRPPSHTLVCVRDHWCAAPDSCWTAVREAVGPTSDSYHIMGCVNQGLQGSHLNLSQTSAQRHRRYFLLNNKAVKSQSGRVLEVLEVDILWPRWVARIGVTRSTQACFLTADRQCTSLYMVSSPSRACQGPGSCRQFFTFPSIC